MYKHSERVMTSGVFHGALNSSAPVEKTRRKRELLNHLTIKLKFP
jgi:hypothetical protein